MRSVEKLPHLSPHPPLSRSVLGVVGVGTLGSSGHPWSVPHTLITIPGILILCTSMESKKHSSIAFTCTNEENMWHGSLLSPQHTHIIPTNTLCTTLSFYTPLTPSLLLHSPNTLSITSTITPPLFDYRRTFDMTMEKANPKRRSSCR